MTPPRVSVVMGAHNAGETLFEAIGSIQQQTVPDWELIVTDDGSSDKTSEIACAFAEDPRIIVLRNERSFGSGAARNLPSNMHRARFSWWGMRTTLFVWISQVV